jgi:hypothetical protein
VMRIMSAGARMLHLQCWSSPVQRLLLCVLQANRTTDHIATHAVRSNFLRLFSSSSSLSLQGRQYIVLAS